MYKIPFNTTANPNWHDATKPVHLIPETDDPTGEGERMVALAGNCLVTQGDVAGQRFGEVMLPWQKAYIRYLFGAVDENGERAISRSFLKIGKGQGKTSMLAFIALASVMKHAADGTAQRGVLMIISATLATANICFSHILEAVKNDPELAGQFDSNTTRRQLTHVESGIVIQVSSAKLSDTVGRRIFQLIVDETHLASVESKNFSSIIDQARRGGLNYGKRFLEVHISTAPPEVSTGLYSDLLNYSRDIRDGKKVDASFLPVLFEFPVKAKGIDIDDPEQWWRACPSAGDDGTMKIVDLVTEFNSALKTGIERDLALFLSQRLGVEPRDNRAAGVSPLREFWLELPAPENPSAIPQVIALDPSSGTDDPFATCMLWREDDKVAVRCKQYLTHHGYSRAGDALRATYDKAKAMGELVLCDTAEELSKSVVAECERYQDAGCCIIGGDQHGLTGFVSSLEEKCIEYVPVSQGWLLLKSLELADALALDRKLCPVKSPLFTSNIDNMELENGPSGRRFVKRDAGLSGQGQAKIDGLMALLSGLELLYSQPAETDVSYWIG